MSFLFYFTKKVEKLRKYGKIKKNASLWKVTSAIDIFFSQCKCTYILFILTNTNTSTNMYIHTNLLYSTSEILFSNKRILYLFYLFTFRLSFIFIQFRLYLQKWNNVAYFHICTFIENRIDIVILLIVSGKCTRVPIIYYLHI